ncbi:HAD-IIB family hydrolase [Salipiger aestuarii]|uniref:HAD-IIB family hydrolase n=1 Tax=Salipiger aestuarii TaxID=568098 RepID=UPI00123C0E3A|nr:HAD-IIB family hydrolase [Salipiger aestuarii]KAA8606959.1 alpha,alpha-trehalose-phosphate synthase [Salipiger aestuarii]
MSLDHHPHGRDIAGCRFVLATDLDGTFLGGSEQDRARLYDWIEANRQSIGLIFVTGRDPKFIRELCDAGVPWPEYVVGDVGTTIARVRDGTIHPIEPLEVEIADTWADAGDTVRAALAGHPGLTLQPTDFRYRVSYDLDASTFDASAHQKIRDIGHDPLVSDNRYFDVLPRGISKGPSLRRLVAHLGIEEDRVLAAGDTLNDLSMLQCGLRAVAVGGAEQDLLDQVSGLSQVHTAEAIGAAGILEAVGAFDLHPLPEGA